MCVNLQKKQQFLRIISKDKYVKQNNKFLKKLYRKFLNHYKIYGKCNASELFEVSTCRNTHFYINRGYTVEEAEQEVKKRQSRGLLFYNGDNTKINERIYKRQKTFNDKSINEINDINKRKGLGYNVAFIANKYCISEKEAYQKIANRKLRKVNSYKQYLNNIGGYKKEWSARCIEYYIKQGLTEQEAIITRRNKFDTRSLEAIIKRRGVDVNEAKKIQHNTALKCKKTFESKTPEEIKEVLIKRTKFCKKYSNKSKKYFDRLVKLLNLDLTYLYADFEYFIYCNNKIFWYDFTIPELKIIIEYNGIIFHPRNKDTWVSTVEESINKDRNKYDVATSKGFTVLYVWENEEQKTIEYILDVIKKQYNIKYESI